MAKKESNLIKKNEGNVWGNVEESDVLTIFQTSKEVGVYKHPKDKLLGLKTFYSFETEASGEEHLNIFSTMNVKTFYQNRILALINSRKFKEGRPVNYYGFD